MVNETGHAIKNEIALKKVKKKIALKKVKKKVSFFSLLSFLGSAMMDNTGKFSGSIIYVISQMNRTKRLHKRT